MKYTCNGWNSDTRFSFCSGIATQVARGLGYCYQLGRTIGLECLPCSAGIAPPAYGICYQIP